MAIFEITNGNDEIAQFQKGRYISRDESFWRILGFPIHDKHPTVVHLAVQLKNEQRVYFTKMADNPSNTTLTAFFETCKNDPFARTLLYPEVRWHKTAFSNFFHSKQRHLEAAVVFSNVLMKEF